MDQKIKFFIGIDGGGTGTRMVIWDASKSERDLYECSGGPSALSLGSNKAWSLFTELIKDYFLQNNLKFNMQECALGMGLSGANNSSWKQTFLNLNPGFPSLVLETDGRTTLIGAHAGKAGSIIALGTGSIGMHHSPERGMKFVSGWGFPSGDEASGSWLGLKALRLAEKTIDGRRINSPLTEEIFKYIGNGSDAILDWLSHANQNTYALLAPLVFQTAHIDKDSLKLLQEAGQEVSEMALALDPDLKYPLSICGRLGEALIPFTPKNIRDLHSPPKGDSARGALILCKEHFYGKN